MIGSEHFTALLLALCKWSFSMISSSSMKFTIALILAPLHGQSLLSSWHYIHVNFFSSVTGKKQIVKVNIDWKYRLIIHFLEMLQNRHVAIFLKKEREITIIMALWVHANAMSTFLPCLCFFIINAGSNSKLRSFYCSKYTCNSCNISFTKMAFLKDNSKRISWGVVAAVADICSFSWCPLLTFIFNENNLHYRSK